MCRFNEPSQSYTGTEQDWDIEMADSGRINDFLKFYQKNELTSDKRVAVMSLILASYEDYLNENHLAIDNKWDEIKLLLQSERRIFADLIDYWSLGNETNEDDFFRITSLIRGL